MFTKKQKGIALGLTVAFLFIGTSCADAASVKCSSSKKAVSCTKIQTKTTATPVTPVSDFSTLSASFKDVDKYINYDGYIFPTSNLKIGPNLDPIIKKNIPEVYQLIGSVFSPFYAPTYYYSIITSELDVAWGASPEINRVDDRWKGYSVDINGKTCENGNGGNEWSSISCMWSNKTEWWRNQLLAHEYVHSVLYTTGGTKFGKVTNYQRAFDIPSWLNEGAATYYGWWLAQVKDKNIEKNIGRHLAGFGCMIPGYNDLKTQDKFVSEMTLIETGKGNWAKQYGYGAVSVAELIKYYGGHKAMLNFYERMRTTSDWKIAFKESFGITPEDFYKAEYKDFMKISPSLSCKLP
jgi:hypothetical protein